MKYVGVHTVDVMPEYMFERLIGVRLVCTCGWVDKSSTRDGPIAAKNHLHTVHHYHPTMIKEVPE
jgi:hypothetical protein